jgi:hypothetical protein
MEKFIYGELATDNRFSTVKDTPAGYTRSPLVPMEKWFVVPAVTLQLNYGISGMAVA